MKYKVNFQINFADFSTKKILLFLNDIKSKLKFHMCFYVYDLIKDKLYSKKICGDIQCNLLNDFILYCCETQKKKYLWTD